MEEMALVQLTRFLQTANLDHDMADLELLAQAAGETIAALPEVLQVLGTLGAAKSMLGLVHAAYSMGVRYGRKHAGLTFVVAPDSPEVCEN